MVILDQRIEPTQEAEQWELDTHISC